MRSPTRQLKRLLFPQLGNPTRDTLNLPSPYTPLRQGFVWTVDNFFSFSSLRTSICSIWSGVCRMSWLLRARREKQKIDFFIKFCLKPTNNLSILFYNCGKYVSASQDLISNLFCTENEINLLIQQYKISETATIGQCLFQHSYFLLFLSESFIKDPHHVCLVTCTAIDTAIVAISSPFASF